jgi:hypothetical protein
MLASIATGQLRPGLPPILSGLKATLVGSLSPKKSSPKRAFSKPKHQSFQTETPLPLKHQWLSEPYDSSRISATASSLYHPRYHLTSIRPAEPHYQIQPREKLLVAQPETIVHCPRRRTTNAVPATERVFDIPIRQLATTHRMGYSYTGQINRRSDTPRSDTSGSHESSARTAAAPHRDCASRPATADRCTTGRPR